MEQLTFSIVIYFVHVLLSMLRMLRAWRLAIGIGINSPVPNNGALARRHASSL